MTNQPLSANLFATIVEHTPLISIDLIVKNSDSKVLLGKRTNAPAKGYWFTPGGRVYKNEKITDAFRRIVLDELGLEKSLGSASFLGTFEHFYSDSVFGKDISTHYIVLAYNLPVNIDTALLPYSQHHSYKWIATKDIMKDDAVHKNVKLYFQ